MIENNIQHLGEIRVSPVSPEPIQLPVTTPAPFKLSDNDADGVDSALLKLL
jgi:hypothetical protein